MSIITILVKSGGFKELVGFLLVKVFTKKFNFILLILGVAKVS